MMSSCCEAKVYANATSILRPLEPGVATFQFVGSVLLLARRHFEAGKWQGWLVPFNGGLWVLSKHDAVFAGDLLPNLNDDAADDHNMSLVTCRRCGGWLQYGTCTDYGTTLGICGACWSDMERGE